MGLNADKEAGVNEKNRCAAAWEYFHRQTQEQRRLLDSLGRQKK